MKKGRHVVWKMLLTGRAKGQVRKELMDWGPERGETYFGVWKCLEAMTEGEYARATERVNGQLDNQGGQGARPAR